MNASMQILLVDDSPFFLTIERRFLKKTPARILEARDGRQALSACRQHRPSLVYMALELPDLDGAACCRQMKTDPDLKEIPVVLVCEENQPEQLERCRQAGCDGILTKPLDGRCFLEMGRSFLPGIAESRQACLIPVRFRWQEEEFSSKGLDISNGGIFLESWEKIPVGSSLELALFLPGMQSAAVECLGEIVWINRNPDRLKPNFPEGFGVKFTDMPKVATALIKEFIDKKGRG